MTNSILISFVQDLTGRSVIDISRMPNIVFLRCFGVQFGSVVAQNLVTLCTCAVVGSDDEHVGVVQSFLEYPQFWPILSDCAPNVRNLCVSVPAFKSCSLISVICGAVTWLSQKPERRASKVCSLRGRPCVNVSFEQNFSILFITIQTG